MDNDGWADILICNGHVYPEVEQFKTEAGYAQRKLLYQNLRNGQFADVSLQAGPGISDPSASRGGAFGDFDNDGDIDVVVNTVNDYPQLLRCDSNSNQQLDQSADHWNEIEPQRDRRADQLCDSACRVNRNLTRQIDEVRSGGGYFSQNDLRVHFGLGKAEKVDGSRFAGRAGKWTH